MNELTSRRIVANGIELYITEQGEGPLVLFCHGFPESGYSWRRQLPALAAAGCHAVAPDMRGYGRSDRPPEIEAYSLTQLVGDMVGLVDALGETRAVIVGHDWGAPVAWHAALMRPDIFHAVVGLSVPYRPRSRLPPTSLFFKNDKALYYQLYFQEPGVAEAELDADIGKSLRTILTARFNGDRALGLGMVPHGGGFLDAMTAPNALPDWLTPDDLARFTADYTPHGFRGGLNWYRNIDRNWRDTAPFAGAKIAVPALYLAGDRDIVVQTFGIEKTLALLADWVPHLRDAVIYQGCGHWTQQERAAEVNEALIKFLGGL